MNHAESIVIDHYEAQYFNHYQKEYGEFGGRANKFMFETHVSPKDAVLDFGCGGGFLLANLECKRKIGVEINPVAREYCNRTNGIPCFESLDEVEDGTIDVVVSSHCLEHTSNPLGLVCTMFEKLKPGGKVIIVVPLDSYQYQWSAEDINKHLYSFSPMNLGNILAAAGFSGIETAPVLHKWVPGCKTIEKFFGLKVFHFLSRIYGSLNKRSVQVRGIGIKK